MQKRKFDSLVNKMSNTNGMPENWVVDLTSNGLGTLERSVLERGLNYAVTPTQIPVNDFIAGIEGGIKNTSSQEVDSARQKI